MAIFHVMEHNSSSIFILLILESRNGIRFADDDADAATAEAASANGLISLHVSTFVLPKIYGAVNAIVAQLDYDMDSHLPLLVCRFHFICLLFGFCGAPVAVNLTKER